MNGAETAVKHMNPLQLQLRDIRKVLSDDGYNNSFCQPLNHAIDRMAELERQRDDLLNVMKKAQDLIELCEDPWEAARLLDKTIAKAGGV